MNIMPETICAAIGERLRETFPGETLYTDFAPRDFDRPSNLVELVAVTLDPLSMGRGAVALRYTYKITTFSLVDEVRRSHLPVLDLRAMMVMGIVGQGFLKVADRALTVRSCQADTALFDAAEVTLALELTVDRAEFEPAALLPIMEELSARLITTKEEKV